MGEETELHHPVVTVRWKGNNVVGHSVLSVAGSVVGLNRPDALQTAPDLGHWRRGRCSHQRWEGASSLRTFDSNCICAVMKFPQNDAFRQGSLSGRFVAQK